MLGLFRSTSEKKVITGDYIIQCEPHLDMVGIYLLNLEMLNLEKYLEDILAISVFQ